MFRSGGSRMSPAILLAGMAALMCAGLVVLMKYARVQIQKNPPAAAKPATPESPFAARIAELSRNNKNFYFITQAGGDDNDDAPGDGKWVRHAEPGLYLDAVSDRVLFSSTDKLESIDGQAEFRTPAAPEEVLEVPRTPPLVRLRSKTAGTWLGRLADDRTAPGQKRYVINSTALSFVPAAELEARGLGEWRRLFPAPPPPAN
jgi:peptide methionine sulfoxide reductase MsrB